LKAKYTTEDIIKGCREGKAPSQKALVECYSELLYSVALRYTGDETKSYDLLQDAFIRIFKSFKTYDPERGSLVAWMRKIMVNVALKSLNKKNLTNSSLSIEINNQYAELPSIVASLNAEDLMKIVMELPEGYRQVFNLSVIEGFSHKDIASMLGIKEVSSRSNLSRAKQILRKKIQSSNNELRWKETI